LTAAPVAATPAVSTPHPLINSATANIKQHFIIHLLILDPGSLLLSGYDTKMQFSTAQQDGNVRENTPDF